MACRIRGCEQNLTLSVKPECRETAIKGMHSKLAIAVTPFFKSCGTAVAALLLGGLVASARPDLHLVSARDASQPGPAGGGGDSFMPILSADGRYVLFGSTAANLALADSGAAYRPSNPPKINVYLRDRLSGTAKLVSVNLSGTGGSDDDCIPLGLSTNAQFALFESGATSLVAGHTNSLCDVFVRDLLNNVTVLVSASTNGTGANGKSFWDSAMTPDGRYVAFTSAANNLVPRYTNGIPGVFVRDLSAGTTTLISVDAKNAILDNIGVPASRSEAPCISPDGHYVAFLSTATNLVPGVTSTAEIYVRDLWASATLIVSSNAHAYIAGPLRTYSPRLSDDGQWLAFQASAATSPANAYVFRHNIGAGTDELISSNAAPPEEDYRSTQTLDMTPDGRFITFIASTNVGGTTIPCVFRWDGQTGTTILVNIDINGGVPVGSVAESPLVDATGRYISFKCTGANLTTNQVDSGPHFYVRDLQAGSTTLIDASTNGIGSARDLRSPHCMTPDGRSVAFDCTDADLVPQDDNQAIDVFVRNLATSQCELVSVHATGLDSQTCAPANNSAKLSLSADGRFLAFAATTRAVLGNCTNSYRGVFVRDLVYGTNLLVSVDSNGLPFANGVSTEPSISADGRFVVFTSAANNLVSGDTNGLPDVFRRDLQSGTTTLISQNVAGTGPGNCASHRPRVSRDGRYVLFYSASTNLAVNPVYPYYGFFDNLFLRDCALGKNWGLTVVDVQAASMSLDGRFIAYCGSITNGGLSDFLYVWDSQAAKIVYTNSALHWFAPFAFSPSGQWLAVRYVKTILLDLVANTNLLVSTDLGGSSGGSRPGLRFSGEGRFLTYISSAGDVPQDTNRIFDVYLYDSWTGNRQLVSQSPITGQAGNGISDAPDVSADGRYVAYESWARDIASPVNGLKNVYLRDMRTGETVLLSTSIWGGGTANGGSVGPVFSGDGQTLVFHSAASDLVTNDFNQGPDIFVLKIASTNPLPAYAGQLIYVPQGQTALTLSWPAAPGCSYQVQFKDNPTDPIWRALNSTVTYTENQARATDQTPGASHRFYRIVASRP